MASASIYWCIQICSLAAIAARLTSGSGDGQDFGNAGLTTVEAILREGYPAEEHKVTTEDGYILTLHRIPHGRTKTSDRRPVVLLQHGLAASSAIWTTLGPPNSLAFLLADNGYDVWLGNPRGNKYSLENEHISSFDLKFWDFSWHEMGVFDLPKMIDYILFITKEKKIFYVCHSMGTNLAMVLLSMQPTYNNRIAHMFLLAPAIFVEEIRSPVLLFLCRDLSRFQEIIGPQPWFPADAVASAGWRFCKPDYSISSICPAVYELIAGPSNDIILDWYPAIISNIITATSAKVFRHFGQCFESGRFRPYDYGKELNRIYYANEEPPDYNLNLMKVPVSIFYSEGDYAVHPKNVERLIRILPNVSSVEKIPFSIFNHYDFIFGKDAKELIFSKILTTLVKY